MIKVYLCCNPIKCILNSLYINLQDLLKHSLSLYQLLNPFHSDGLFKMHLYNTYGIVHFVFLRGRRSKFLISDVCMSLKLVFILANSADPDEILHNATFHLGLHCLPKYLFTGIQNE